MCFDFIPLVIFQQLEKGIINDLNVTKHMHLSFPLSPSLSFSLFLSMVNLSSLTGKSDFFFVLRILVIFRS